jgi:hypothetical protein
MKKIFMMLASLLMITLACKKEKEQIITTPINVVDEPTVGFKAKVIIGNNSIKKVWVSTSSNKANSNTPISGVDFFASRGGINSNQLNLMSFGKFTDDLSNLAGRITIFINNVSDTGSFVLDNNNYAVLSILNNDSLKHYATDINNKGELNITKYDTVNNTISGNFSFQAAVNSNTLTLQNGTFLDIPFKQ